LRRGRSKLRSTAIAAALLAVLGGLSLSSASLADAPGENVFAGIWSISVAGRSGSLTFKVVTATSGAADLTGSGGTACTAPSTYYYGSLTSPLLNGQIAACTVDTPDHLVGRFSQGNDLGDWDVTFTAPDTFAGTLDFRGTDHSVAASFAGHTPDDGCCAGPAPGTPASGSPPPSTPPSGTPPASGSGTTTNPGSTAPTSTSPQGSSPPPGSSPTSSAPQGGTPTASTPAGSPVSKPSSPEHAQAVVVIPEPAPGTSATVSSPNRLAANAPAASLDLTDSLGDFPGTTIVAPGELHVQPTGETVACWLIGPDPLQVPSSAYGQSLDLKLFYGRLKAAEAYTACAGSVRAITGAGGGAPSPTPQPPTTGCSAQRIVIAMAVHSGLITGARPVASPPAGPSSVRYSCLRAVNGSLTIAVTAPGKGGLPAVFGSHLQLGVVRPASAPARNATLSFAFGGSLSGPARGATSWTGSWNSNHGAVRLTQHGTKVTGTYPACAGKAVITGKVSGSSLSGTWSQPCDSRGGRLRFTLGPTGETFSGTWGYGSDAMTLSWDATRS
jgi:hypothetical protein